MPSPATKHIPVLPSLLESRVEICPDNSLVELGATNIFQAIQRILVRVVFDKAEAAGGFVVSVEAHNEALDLSASEWSVRERVDIQD